MTTEEKYKDILYRERPWDAATLQRHPRMSLQDRAKIFAPFAALRGHSERLQEETGKLLRGRRPELSEEESEILNLKLAQIKEGMRITALYFLADHPGSEMGNHISLCGTVTCLDPVSRYIRITTGETNEKGAVETTIPLDDLLDLGGDGIVDPMERL
ncbi:MAG: hypothetical protein LUC27_06525 [Lachnospiraceae bacterium]|nr:hypothetical protein [Lachnospiraceae bacterium]